MGSNDKAQAKITLFTAGTSSNKSNKVWTSSGQHKAKSMVNSGLSTPFDKEEQLKMFKMRVKNQKTQGLEYENEVSDIHVTLLQKELYENVDTNTGEPVFNPLKRHQVTKEYRTKMTDWMIEVCTSFKCSRRTYFLSHQVFDHYLNRLGKNGKYLVNKDVHAIGCTAMYLASKYEDIYPLHSKVVSEKIAHKAISMDDIQVKERAFLADFDYDIDFVSHWDFWQTYSDKLRFHFSKKP